MVGPPKWGNHSNGPPAPRGQLRVGQKRNVNACFRLLSLLPGVEIYNGNTSNFPNSRKLRELHEESEIR